MLHIVIVRVARAAAVAEKLKARPRTLNFQPYTVPISRRESKKGALFYLETASTSTI